MEKRTALILFFSIITSIFILIILIIFIYKIFKLYNKKQIEYSENIQILKLEKEKELLNTRISAQEETFELIGREIHDNINQLLTLSKLNLNSIDYRSPNEIKIKVEYGVQFIGEAIQGLTNISKSLNAELIKDSGITSVLAEEIFRINLLKSTKIIFEYDEEVNNISPEIQLIIFRISQEALRNAMTHGQAKRIHIHLKIIENSIIFEIMDNGIGFDPNILGTKKFSQGLRNIEKRIGIIDGILTIDSKVGIGTKIKIVIPNFTKSKV